MKKVKSEYWSKNDFNYQQALKPKKIRTNIDSHTCYACGGTMKQGETTFTVDFGTGVVVVRNVPAWVCSQCGMDWIRDELAGKLEEIVIEAKAKHSVVEVMSLSD